MRKTIIKGFFLLSVVVLVITACDDVGQLQLPTKERVTFALVLNTRIYDGLTIFADLKENVEGGAKETIEGIFDDYPNTTIQSWAKMTTLEKIWTNQGYFLDFYIDMDGSDTKTTGDMTGVQNFDVRTNAVWSETKYYAEELTTVD